MPIVEITTNVQVQDPKQFVKELFDMSVDALKIPASIATVCYTFNETLMFGGTFDPAFHLQLHLFNDSPHKNIILSKKFFDFFERTLGVSGERGYIIFNQPEAYNVGYNGTTLAAQGT